MKNKVSKDILGDRMKDFYENRTRYFLPRRAYTIIRIDGKAFHTYTKGLDRPFDFGLIEDMDETTKYLCKNIQGAKFGYVQSDEISLLLTDFDDIDTSAWFDNNIQKMCSVSASMATNRFNRLRTIRHLVSMGNLLSGESLVPMRDAEFDSRVFQIPSKTEVINYFRWRIQDCVRNSISSVAQSMFSHKELMGKNSAMQQEMIFQKKGINWSEYDPKLKNGRLITKETVVNNDSVRTRWTTVAAPYGNDIAEVFTRLIPPM